MSLLVQRVLCLINDGLCSGTSLGSVQSAITLSHIIPPDDKKIVLNHHVITYHHESGTTYFWSQALLNEVDLTFLAPFSSMLVYRSFNLHAMLIYCMNNQSSHVWSSQGLIDVMPYWINQSVTCDVYSVCQLKNKWYGEMSYFLCLWIKNRLILIQHKILKEGIPFSWQHSIRSMEQFIQAEAFIRHYTVGTKIEIHRSGGWS